VATRGRYRFLYREASLLDRPDLDRWMETFTEDGTYWMPGAEGQSDPLNHILHIYDDREMMEVRRHKRVDLINPEAPQQSMIIYL